MNEKVPFFGSALLSTTLCIHVVFAYATSHIVLVFLFAYFHYFHITYMKRIRYVRHE